MATTKFKGQPVKVIGEFIKVGAVAPDFELVKTDLSSFSLKELNGKNVILNIFRVWIPAYVPLPYVNSMNYCRFAGYGGIGCFKGPAFCTCPFLYDGRY